MGLLKLFIVPAQNKLVTGRSSKMAASLPAFVQGDQLTLELLFLELDSSGLASAPWKVISAAGLTPKIGLFKADGTQLAYQNTFTPDVTTNILSGTLNLDTAEVTTALTAVAVGSSLTCYVEIKMTVGTDTLTALQATAVELYKTLITAATTSVQPPDVGASQSWALNTFVRADGLPGAPQIIQSAGGKKVQFYIDENWQPHWDPVV